jgi:hypothetical protein
VLGIINKKIEQKHRKLAKRITLSMKTLSFILMYPKGTDKSKAARESSALLRGQKALVCPP